MSDPSEPPAPDSYDAARARVRGLMAQERARAEAGWGVPTGEIPRRSVPAETIADAGPAREAYEEAVQALEDGADDLAEAALRRCLARGARDPAVWRELALLEVAQRRFEGGLRAADEWLKAFPDDPEARRARAMSLDGLTRGPEALAAWRAFFAVAPEDWGPERRQADNRMHHLGAPPKSEETGFQGAKMPRAAPPWDGPTGEAGALYQAARKAHEIGRVDEAEAGFRRAVRHAERDPAPWRELGFLLADQNRFDEARAALERAAILAPDDFESQRILGVACERLGDLPAADAAYRRFLEGCPEREHQRLRMHAEGRRAAIARGDAGPDGPGYDLSSVEEIVPRAPPPWWVLAGVAALLYAVFWREAPPPPPRTWRPAGEVLRDFRADAVELLAAAGAPAPPDLRALEDGGTLRAVAAEVIAAGGTDGVDAVARLLSHPEPRRQRIAVDALAADGSPSARRSLTGYVVGAHDAFHRFPVEAACEALVGWDDPDLAASLVGGVALAERRKSRLPRHRKHLRMLHGALRRLRHDEVVAAAEDWLARLGARDLGPADRRSRAAVEALR